MFAATQAKHDSGAKLNAAFQKSLNIKLKKRIQHENSALKSQVRVSMERHGLWSCRS